MLVDEILDYCDIDDTDFSLWHENKRWVDAARTYVTDDYEILGINYFDNCEISDQIMQKHGIANDAYLIIAANVDRFEDGENLNLKQVWVNRFEFLDKVYPK